MTTNINVIKAQTLLEDLRAKIEAVFEHGSERGQPLHFSDYKMFAVELFDLEDQVQAGAVNIKTMNKTRKAISALCKEYVDQINTKADAYLAEVEQPVNQVAGDLVYKALVGRINDLFSYAAQFEHGLKASDRTLIEGQLATLRGELEAGNVALETITMTRTTVRAMIDEYLERVKLQNGC